MPFCCPFCTETRKLHARNDSSPIIVVAVVIFPLTFSPAPPRSVGRSVAGGCCCDYRRAVIIVSIIFIVASGLSLIFAIVGATAPGVNTVDDDTLIALTDSNVTLNIVVAAVGLAMAITGLIGARMYNIPMLAIVAVWFLVSFGIGVYTIIDTINLYNDSPNTTEDYRIPYGWLIFQFVVTCLWIYPFLGLIAEIKKGIMSYETYPREEYSCCCVSNTGRRLQ